jgi:hypothetical protein
MDALFLSVWTWVNNAGHLLEIGVAGTALAQLSAYLPAKFPGRAKIVNALHGIFPSPQVFVNGATTEIAELEKVAPIVENILELLENEQLNATGKTIPVPTSGVPASPESKP